MDNIEGFVWEKIEKMLKQNLDSFRKIGKHVWPFITDSEQSEKLPKLTADLYKKETESFEKKIAKLHREKAASPEIARTLKAEIDQLQKTNSFYKALSFHLALEFRKSRMIEEFTAKRADS